MDSGGGGNRQETQVYKSNNMENANEPVEEIVPKILSSEIRDVFPIFANILDAKSFTRLAMTSKEMYSRCMDDKTIKINVYAYVLEAKKENGSLLFNLSSDAVNLLPCKVILDFVDIHQNLETADVIALHNYMKKIGVNIIYSLSIMCENAEWEAVIAMIKDFDVISVDLLVPVADDILRSFLQLNLNSFWYNGPIPVAFVLEMESSVREITFANIRPKITKEQLLYITSRIQSGSLPQLNVYFRAIDWDEFEYDMLGLPLNNDEPLTEYRPLLLSTQPFAPTIYNPQDYWLLDRDGGVTRLITRGVSSSPLEWNLQMFKCEPKDYPWILRKEEDVLKDLAEKHPRVSCSASQFHKFCESLPMIDRSHKWLPADRPLYYKVNEHVFWLLDVRNQLMRCCWQKYVAIWRPFTSLKADLPFEELDNSLLAKYVFCKLVSWMDEYQQFDLHCEGLKELDRWFAGVGKLDFEYSGPLPSTRPLVFWKSARSRIVLLKYGLVECQFFKNTVTIQPCQYFNRPPILFTAKSVAEMLKDPCHYGERSIRMSLEMFYDGFKMFRRSPSARLDRHLIWEQAAGSDGLLKEEYWYKIDNLVRKVVWKEEHVILKEENDLRDAPPNFRKQVFRFFAETQTKDPNTSFTMELEQFHSCSEHFTVVPFDYSGTLIRDSPMAFVKNETRHIFHMGPTCQCSDSFIHVWFLWNGNRVTNCSWGRRKPKEVEFRGWTNEMPPALGNFDPPTDTSTPSSS